MNGAGAPARLRVARVLRPHGVRGELRVEPLGGDAARFKPGLRLLVEMHDAPSGPVTASASAPHSPAAPAPARSTPPSTLVVRSARAAGGAVLVAFEGIDGPQAAALLRGAYLCVDSRDARPLGKDEWFVWQLVGLRAQDASGRGLGVVTDVEEGVANDVLVLERDGRVRRVPMVTAFVSGVDVPGGVITLEEWQEE
jgi:16S rRNA processing protein RimM